MLRGWVGWLAWALWLPAVTGVGDVNVIYERVQNGIYLPVKGGDGHLLLRYETLVFDVRSASRRWTTIPANASIDGTVRLECDIDLFESTVTLQPRQDYYNYTTMFATLTTSLAIVDKRANPPFQKELDAYYSLFENRHPDTLFKVLLLIKFSDAKREVYESFLYGRNISDTCRLHLLPADEQVLAPSKEIAIDGHPLVGVFPIKEYVSTCPGRSTNKTTAMLSEVFEEMDQGGATNDMLLDLSEKDTTFPETEEEYADVMGILGEVSDLVDPAMEEAIEPVREDFWKWLASRAMEILLSILPSEAASTVQDSVQREQQPGFAVGLNANLGPALAESLPDKIDGAVSSATATLAAQIISRNTIPPLGDMISLSVASQIAVDATAFASNKIGHITSHTLASSLGRSLPHAIVPALMHTLTHNPMQDYYCYYCYHVKTYCQYCNYAPMQLYYAQYYTGFYSSYYSNYYADYTLSFYSNRKTDVLNRL